MANPMKPTQALLTKLGQIIVHLDEYVETDLHMELKIAREYLDDPEVETWIKEMQGKALLPVKRSQRG